MTKNKAPMRHREFHLTEREAQCERVLNFMRKHGSITQDDAFRHLGVYRLSARIYDLRDQGHNIRTAEKKGRNSMTGDGFSCARYYISRGKRAESNAFPNAPKKNKFNRKKQG